MARTLALAASALLLVSCSERARELGGELGEHARARVAERVELAQNQLAAGAALSADLDQHQQLDYKLAFARDCLASTAEPITTGQDQFHRFVDKDGTPKRKDRAGLVPLSPRRVATCTDAAETTAKEPPQRPELEQALVRYAEAVSAYAEVSAELSAYYAKRRYEQDQFQTTKALTPQLDGAFETWTTAHRDLRQALGSETAALDRARLTTLADTGKDLEHGARSCVVEAQAFVRCLEAEPSAAETCGVQHEAFERAFQQLTNHHKPGASMFWLDEFVAATHRFRTEAGQAMAAAQSGRLRPQSRSRLTVAGEALARDLQNVRFGS